MQKRTGFLTEARFGKDIMIERKHLRRLKWLAIGVLRRTARRLRKLPGFLRHTLAIRLFKRDSLKLYSRKQFDEEAAGYDKGSGYAMVREDYPDILAELKKERYSALLDCGCGTGAVLQLLLKEFPDRSYTGIDLSGQMIAAARRQLPETVTLLTGDCEHLPFPESSFDAVLCSHSFHHYPHPQRFFDSVFRVLKPGGRLILRDNTGSLPYLLYQNWWMIPYINWKHHSGDVRFYSRREVRHFLKKAGFSVICLEERPVHKLHTAARKPLKAR